MEGIFICLDCSGKHREYGAQISAVRSLTFDSWTRRELSFLEVGGNRHAAEYFKHYGFGKPHDYKSPIAQKYKQELIMKVDALILETINEEKARGSETSISTHKQPEKAIEKSDNFFETQATEKPESTFVDKSTTKTQNFSVEFTNKGTHSSKKGFHAKKIDNFDLDCLSLQETVQPEPKNEFFESHTTFSGFDAGHKAEGLETHGSYNEHEIEDKMKKLEHAKHISSENLYGHHPAEDHTTGDMSKYVNSQSISSDQMFGLEKPKTESKAMSKFKAAASSFGEKVMEKSSKIKDKAGGLIKKFRGSESSN